jgi:NADP-dependent aldehyde dehydrogenase
MFYFHTHKLSKPTFSERTKKRQMNSLLTGQQLIAGGWVSNGGASFHAVNPATGETLEPAFVIAVNAEVNAAMSAAENAFAVTRELSAARRAQLLDAIAAQIMSFGDGLLQRAHAETALPLPRLAAERDRTVKQLALYAGMLREGSWVDAVIDTAEPQRQPVPKPDLRRMNRPIGPVVVFGAGNFPFAYGACGGDTASALAAGNPVVVKAHERHPGVNELFAYAVVAALKECDLPTEIFGLLQGPGATVGQALVKHPATQAVGFTGSKRAGRALFDVAAMRSQPIPVFAEMGSLNPVVILPGALAERGDVIAASLAQSITNGAGQFCTKPGWVFVTGSSATDSFLAQLANAMSAIPATTMLTAEMRNNFCNTTSRFRKIPGVKTLLDNPPTGFAAMAPLLLEVDSNTWRQHGELHEEAFGPGAVIVRCRDFADLQKTISHAEGNLTAALHTGPADSAAEVRALAQTLEQRAGRVIFNGYPTGVEVGHAMVHGGPYPATTAPATSSVGALAIRRFVRPVAYQNVPDDLLPPELQNANPLGIWRTVNGEWTRRAL